VKFDPTGGLEWARRISGPRDERPTAVVSLPDGGVVVAGYAPLAGQYRSWVLKIGSGQDGAVAWFQRVVDCAPDKDVGEKDVVVRTALLSHDGDYVLGGRTFYPKYHSLLFKVKPDGSVAWSIEHTSGEGILGLDLRDAVQLPTGAFLNAGIDVSAGNSDAVWLAETDSIGRLLWIRRYETGGQESQPSIFYTHADRGVLVAAATTSWFDYPGGAWVMKVPRKDGRINFAPASGATASDLTPVQTTSCIAMEPYAGGAVTSIDAHLVPLNDVVEKDLDVTVLVTSP